MISFSSLTPRPAWLIAAGVLLAASAGAQEARPPDTSNPPAAERAADAPREPAPEDNAGLRRIDTPDTPPAAPGGESAPNRPRHSGGTDIPFGDHTIAKGVRVREAVSVFGSTVIDGESDSDAVSVFGDTRVGEGARVGGAAIAVFGRVVSRGEIDEAVSVLCGVDLDGPVRGDVGCVLGDARLGPRAVVDGDLVIIGGTLRKHPQAIVRGEEVSVPGMLPWGDLEWLTTWFRRCVLLGRPLAFGPNLGWAWAVAFAFLGFYLLLALLFPRGVLKCVETFETRPGATIVASLVTLLLSPVAIVLLAITVVGALVIPFAGAALFFAGLFGKAVMLAWIGRRFTNLMGEGPHRHPMFGVLIGGLLVMLLYTVYGSFLLYKLLSWLGTGVVVYTIVLSMNREKRAVPPAGAAGPGNLPPGTIPPAAPPPRPVAPAPAGPAAAPQAATGFVATPPPAELGNAGVASADAGASAPSAPSMSAGFGAGAIATEPVSSGIGALPEQPAAPPTPAMPPTAGAATPAVGLPPAPAHTLPRAGFFIRLGALLLDALLIGLILSFVGGLLPGPLLLGSGPGGLLIVLAIYGAVMWKSKGTTIGGIVCGLKVVRVDNREVDWATAWVRALGCFLSLVVAGLGFIWVAFDEDRQAWHDKIAGTTVVHVPKGVSLL